QDGKDTENLLHQLIDHTRSLLLLAVCGPDAALVDETPEDLKELDRQRQRFTVDGLLYMSQVLWDTLRRVKESSQSRLPIELALVKLAQGDGLVPLAELLERLQALETRLGASSAPPQAPAGHPPAPRPAPPPAADEKKKPSPPAPMTAPAATEAESDPERLAEEHSRLQEEAAANPVIGKALHILQGIVINREK
ncbi:MAG TPA: hypothetical protein P5118_24515, partial [Planctomycetota bacterium]|nr:hypothetical protein [Planctomycetota bacterium]